MSRFEFESCLGSNGLTTCGNLPQFMKFVRFGDVGDSGTVATSVSATVSTVLTSVLTTISPSTTAAPSASSCDLTDLKTFVKKVAKSVGEGLGDLSKKTLDSVVESAGFSHFFQDMVDALPTGLLYFILTLCVLGTILLLICYKSRQQARMAAAAVDVLSEIVVRNNLGIFYLLVLILNLFFNFKFLYSFLPSPFNQ